MSLRTAEIAGGGIGGLATAALLARDGWRVRVHERAESKDDLAVPRGIIIH